MQTILVTGGRAPAALELVRLLHASGYRVVMAESLRWHLSRQSWAVARNYFVPWPSREPDNYVDSIAEIIDKEQATLLIPTCEEIYYLAERRERIPHTCVLLAPEWPQLHTLHSKWLFIHQARRYQLAVPETKLLTSRRACELEFESGRELVFKPVYSRFASSTVVRPKCLDDFAAVQPNLEFPWVAQEYISGRQLSTYSLAHEGKLLAHVNYPMNFSTGIGPTFAYEPIAHPAMLQWVAQFVAAERFSGQIAFDFIEREDGSVIAIECNPRSTSGLHLFRRRIDLGHAFVHPEQHTGPMLVPRSRRPVQHTLILLLWAIGYVRSWSELKRWARTFIWGKDILLSVHDPLPLLMFGFNLLPVLARARKYSVNIDQAATMDIEWNGPTKQAPTKQVPTKQAPTNEITASESLLADK
ncbi:ATP-grasp domain-containing protein [Stieleria varia]|uniref:ATP-grasp domain-containing protein n=1 Tax=Stieleria varia TaxID=2528005 RepID=A0A5C6B456_9BACT|nr:hypothetical protein [Stieleria varia]TWU06099.1 hypothetical protein Pla52n_18190 [Stieleria varia]